MLETLRFIFSSFWIFLGVVILTGVILSVVFDGIADIIKAIRGK